VEKGKAGGGLCYGYDVVRRTDSEGEPVRGERKINQAEAVVVRRIFQEFAAGKSPRAIATDLNREGTPGPFGRAWGDTTIRGARLQGQWRRQQRALCRRTALEPATLHQGPEYGQACVAPESRGEMD